MDSEFRDAIANGTNVVWVVQCLPSDPDVDASFGYKFWLHCHAGWQTTRHREISPGFRAFSTPSQEIPARNRLFGLSNAAVEWQAKSNRNQSITEGCLSTQAACSEVSHHNRTSADPLISTSHQGFNDIIFTLEINISLKAEYLLVRDVLYKTYVSRQR